MGFNNKGWKNNKQQDKFSGVLKNLEGKFVSVKLLDGSEIKGVCVAVNFVHMNVAVATKTSLVLIKNVQSIHANLTKDLVKNREDG